MIAVGQKERITQNRVVALFRQTLGYDYLGCWQDRYSNRSIEAAYLRPFLRKQGWSESVVDAAIVAFDRAANAAGRSLYDRNRAAYALLRYGVNVSRGVGENNVTVSLIDWKHPENNHFAIAEEVTVAGGTPYAHTKRPDIVVYINGIALAVLELKRSTVSVAEGIRQNLDNQKKEFIEPFFGTVQYLLAGSDAMGLRYGTIATPEKYYLTWKEDNAVPDPSASLLDTALTQLMDKARFLELLHDFVLFDAGTKKLCRPHQYFGVLAARERVLQGENGIIWHTQGSGKSLTMVWLAKWIRENIANARVLLITDRTELDEQIEAVFRGVDESIMRTKSGAELITLLNQSTPGLIASLIHKFGGRADTRSGDSAQSMAAFLDEIRKALPTDFKPKGKIIVFVDECHRTQSGELHAAMKAILPDALFIGFTGTPLLKADKARSIEVFGTFIHTYKFNQAVKDGVVLDLRYEARDVNQYLSSPQKVDQWFDTKTRGLNDLPKAQIKARWGTIREVLSSQERLDRIVADIQMDFITKDRLMNGRGNALLVCSSIYQACKYYELFARTELSGKCAIITSYEPTAASIKGEETGDGETERLHQYAIYKKMLADWFEESPETAVNKSELFEQQVKEKFVKEPGQMKLLIVVDKLLTGFDAPPATYLYIDKAMRDHGLFQAICRVNRLDSDDKEYGYIVDYKDLFKQVENAVRDYTCGAFDGFDAADVAGLLEDRVAKAREQLDAALETVHALCERVPAPCDTPAYFAYFCAGCESTDPDKRGESERRRLALYRHVASLVRAYAQIANDAAQGGYPHAEFTQIGNDVARFEKVRTEVKFHSGDYVDLKVYEPAMRHLLDKYIRAEDSNRLSSFDDLSLLQLIVERGADAIESLPEGIRADAGSVAETIENNVRRLIISEHPVNPAYYEQMSALLDALIAERKQGAERYQEYLQKVVQLTRKVVQGPDAKTYPASCGTPALRALYDNVGQNERLALAVDDAIRASAQDDWRNNAMKTRLVRRAIQDALQGEESAAQADAVLQLARNQSSY